MLRQKWARYACEIIKDGCSVNQNVVKRKHRSQEQLPITEKRNRKKSKDRGRPITTDSSSKKRQRTTKARGNKLTEVMI